MLISGLVLGSVLVAAIWITVSYRRNAINEASRFLKERRFDRSTKDPWA